MQESSLDVEEFPDDTKLDSINSSDVIFGRGKLVSCCVGNIAFRHIVWSHRLDYQLAPRVGKREVGRMVVQEISGLSGRFVELNPETGGYHKVSSERAVEKACQALRERRMKIPPGFDAKAMKTKKKWFASIKKSIEGGDRAKTVSNGIDFLDKPSQLCSLNKPTSLGKDIVKKISTKKRSYRVDVESVGSSTRHDVIKITTESDGNILAESNTFTNKDCRQGAQYSGRLIKEQPRNIPNESINIFSILNVPISQKHTPVQRSISTDYGFDQLPNLNESGIGYAEGCESLDQLTTSNRENRDTFLPPHMCFFFLNLHRESENCANEEDEWTKHVAQATNDFHLTDDILNDDEMSVITQCKHNYPDGNCETHKNQFDSHHDCIMAYNCQNDIKMKQQLSLELEPSNSLYRATTAIGHREFGTT